MEESGEQDMDLTVFLDRLDKILEADNRKRAYFDLCDLYCQADAEQRDFLRAEWPLDREWLIPLCTMLLHSDAYPSQRRLRVALIYESLEKGEWDLRDNLVRISAIYHSAVRLGLDPQLLFEEVAGLSGEYMADLLRSFARRLPKERSIEVFGYQEKSSPGGIYLAGWGLYTGRCYGLLNPKD
jgi:hypothetical protein